MYIFIWLAVKVCDNSEADSCKAFFCSVKIFLRGKIIPPKIIGWLIYNYHILSVSLSFSRKIRVLLNI